MTLNTSTLRPGLLVSLKTSIRGNVRYNKRDTKTERRDSQGRAISAWETERVIYDPEEQQAATQARTQARLCITRVCSTSAFGLLCPENEADTLEQAMKDARKIADEFNDSAKLTRLTVHVICGRIAADDVEAVRAINSEVRDLLEDMQEGLKNFDVKAIRDAANKARSLGQMLTPDAEARIKIAIEAARATARDIVKAGETAAKEVDQRAIRRITESRMAFLDLEDAGEVTVSKGSGRALDLEPEQKPTQRSKAKARQLEV